MNRSRLGLFTCIFYTCIALLAPAAARASCSPLSLGSIANGQPNNASPVVTAFNTLFTCSTTVDNTQIGVLGIFASQIVPTNLTQATFGGSIAYAFANQLQVNSGADGVISLLVFGHSITQSQPLAQFWNFNGGTEALDVGAAGTLTEQTNTDAAQGIIADGAPDGNQSGSLLSLFVKAGGTQLLAFAPAGCLQVAPTIAMANLLTCVPPVYTPGGAAVASSYHETTYFAFSTTTSGSCGANALCGLTASTFTVAPAFTSNATWGCEATDTTGGDSFSWNITPASGTTGNVKIRNITGTSIGGGAGASATLKCGGT